MTDEEYIKLTKERIEQLRKEYASLTDDEVKKRRFDHFCSHDGEYWFERKSRFAE